MRKWIQTKAAGMTEEGLAYCVALALFALSVLLCRLSRHWNIQLSQVLAYAAIAFLLYGFWSYLSPVLKRASESVVVKVVWAALTVIGVTVSVSLAQVVVNETLQVPSSAFPHTQALVAVLVAPIVIGVFVVALGLILAPVFQVMLYSEGGELSIKSFLSPAPREPGRTAGEAKYIGRFLAFFLALGLCFAGLGRSDSYLNEVGDFVRWFAYHFETERFSNCAVGPEAKVSYISGDQLVLAGSGEESYNFQVVECAVDR